MFLNLVALSFQAPLCIPSPAGRCPVLSCASCRLDLTNWSLGARTLVLDLLTSTLPVSVPALMVLVPLHGHVAEHHDTRDWLEWCPLPLPPSCSCSRLCVAWVLVLV